MKIWIINWRPNSSNNQTSFTNINRLFQFVLLSSEPKYSIDTFLALIFWFFWAFLYNDYRQSCRGFAAHFSSFPHSQTVFRVSVYQSREALACISFHHIFLTCFIPFRVTELPEPNLATAGRREGTTWTGGQPLAGSYKYINKSMSEWSTDYCPVCFHVKI